MLSQIFKLRAIGVIIEVIMFLADAIYGILAYPTLAHYMQREGYDEVNQLKWEKASLKLKNIYESLI